MNLNIKATGIDLTSAIENEVREKMAILAKFLREEDVVRVEVGMTTRHHQSGDIFKAEVHISPDGHYAESEGQDLYEAIDLLIPKIREQLVKSKDKKLSLRKKFGKIKWKFWE